MFGRDQQNMMAFACAVEATSAANTVRNGTLVQLLEREEIHGN
jgi:hypothetical protein